MSSRKTIALPAQTICVLAARQGRCEGLARGSTKRSASPPCSSTPAFSNDAGNASKRCRQLFSGGPIACLTRQSKAQLSTTLRRVQSAPLDTDAVEQSLLDELEYWRSKEETDRRPCPIRMGNIQREVTQHMRTVLVDWMGEVRDEFKLRTDTLFLAVSYVDRFLAAVPVARSELQLLGLAALWVAAKMEEVYLPPVNELLEMADKAYSLNQLLDMEAKLLFTLQFALTPPTSCCFLPYLLALAPLPPHPDAAASARRLAAALLELTLLDTAFAAAPPSHVAAAAVYVALGMLEHHAFALQAVASQSGADAASLGLLIKRLARLLCECVWDSDRKYCALLARYLSWEGVAGTDAFRIAVATAADVVCRRQPWGAAPAAAAAVATKATPPAGAVYVLSQQCCMATAAALSPAAAMLVA